MKKHIVHIAYQNIAGLPSTFSKVERELGFESTLITMMPHPNGFENGICLNYPFFANKTISTIKKILKHKERFTSIKDDEIMEKPPVWRPKNLFNKIFFDLRDNFFYNIVKKNGILDILENADILVIDSGLGLLRSGRIEYEWAKKHNRMVSVYYGSDLRSRGVITAIDFYSQLHFTLEFDHLKIHPKAKYIFYPFDTKRVPRPPYQKNKKITIGHSPTKRNAKGTDIILNILNKLKDKGLIEIMLIENFTYNKAVELQSTCDIFIDQITDIGYGLSGLQSLAMGIPTLVSLTDEYERFLQYHPFVNVNKDNLEHKLMELIENENLRKGLSQKGIEWVNDVHNPVKSTKTMIEEYKRLGWL